MTTAVLTPRRHDRRAGIVLMVLAASLFSLGGILVRSISASGWDIVMWRSVFLVVALSLYIGLRPGSGLVRQITAMGWPGVMAGLFLGTTSLCYIFALQLTTVANTLIICSSAPFLAAFFAWLFLREAIRPHTVVTMGIGAIGMAIMFWDSIEAGHGMLGNLLAFGVALALALNLVTLRSQASKVDMVPSVLIAGLYTLAVSLPFAWPGIVSLPDLGIIAVLGLVQLALPLVLLTMATRHLTVAEVALLQLLEVLLAPIWVWLAFDERPSDWALIGGTIVLGALIANAALGARRG